MAEEIFTTRLRARRWLSPDTYEVDMDRPDRFHFRPGQHIRFDHEGLEREYSPVSTATDAVITLCVRDTRTGNFSTALAHAPQETSFRFSGPHGYFLYTPSSRPAVFAATGTGIAPFVSMVRSGVTGFLLLHGVRTAEECFYESLFRTAARGYVPCLSGAGKPADPPDAFYGRVTDYVAGHLPSSPCDFYLCGRQEMIRDITFLVDEHFPQSRIYSETFY